MARHSNFIVRGGANFNTLYQELNKAQKRMNVFKSTMTKTMKGLGLALSGIAIARGVKNSTKAAITVESSMAQLSRTMGDNASEFEDWAKTQSKAFGMARDEAFKYGATYSNLISTFTKSTKETTKYTTDSLKASAVVASATGRTMEDTMERIRSGLLGNTEAIEDLGINVNVAMLESTEAFRKFAKDRSWQQLTFQEQQQIRLMAILEQAYAKYGDSLAGTTATKQMMFLATLKNIRLNLGQAFLPIYNVVLPALTSLASKIESVTAKLAAFTQALFGKSVKTQVKNTQAQAGAVEELGDATEKAGKQAKGALAGFDEINSLNMNEGGGSGVVGGVGVDTEELVTETDDGTGGVMGTVATKAVEMATKVREAFTNMKNAIIENKNIIIPALGAIAGAIAGVYLALKAPAILATVATLIDKVKKFGLAIKGAWAFLAAHPIVAVVAAIGALIGALVGAYLTNDEFRARVDKLWERIKIALTPVIQKLGEVLQWLWDSVLLPVGKVIKDVLVVAFDALTYAVKWLWEYVLVPLGNFVIQSLVPVLVELAKIIGTIIKVAVEALIKVFEYLWHNVLEPLLEWLGSTFKPIFEVTGNGIKTIIEGLQTIFDGLIKFITGVFTGNWRKAWDGVLQIFRGVGDVIKGIVNTVLGYIESMVNGMISAINYGIDKINNMVKSINKVLSKLGMPTISFNVPRIPEVRIPRLKNGGITDVNNPFWAIVGDNPTQKEVISPLDDLMEMITSAVGTAIMASNQFDTSNNDNSPIILQIDGTTFARIIGPYVDKESERIGDSLVIQTI